jgi:adenosine deaminase
VKVASASSLQWDRPSAVKTAKSAALHANATQDGWASQTGKACSDKTGLSSAAIVATHDNTQPLKNSLTPLSLRLHSLNSTHQRVEQALDEVLSWMQMAPVDTLTQAQLESFTRTMPKVDLHRHLEGSIGVQTLLDMAAKHGIELPADDLESLRPWVQITPDDKSLLDFLAKFDTIGKIFKSSEGVKELTKAAIQDLEADGIAHAELRFSPLYIAQHNNLEPEEVLKAVIEGVREATAKGKTTIRLILIVERQMGVEPAALVANLAQKYQKEGVVALDLANDEAGYPPGPYADVFQQAKKAGLKVTVHAGEAAGAQNVRSAIEDLGADRIGHGVRTRQDPEVMQLVKDTQTPLELCPTSNIQTGACENIEAHPLLAYFKQGLKVTVNTDDPSISGINLSSEFAMVAKHFSLTLKDLHTLSQNAVDGAFLEGAQKEKLRLVVKQGFQDGLRQLGRSLSPNQLKSLAQEGIAQSAMSNRDKQRHLLRLEQLIGFLSLQASSASV